MMDEDNFNGLQIFFPKMSFNILGVLTAAAIGFGASKLLSSRNKKAEALQVQPITQRPPIAQRARQAKVGQLGDLAFNEPLSRFAQAGIAGQGTGFGKDFVSRATNPAAQSIQNRLTRQTLPGIASDFSSRGLGRSGGGGLATGALQRARENASQDISQLIANFEVLNQQQKKSDQRFAVGLGQQQQGVDIGQRGSRVNVETGDIERQRAIDQFNQSNLINTDRFNAGLQQFNFGQRDTAAQLNFNRQQASDQRAIGTALGAAGGFANPATLAGTAIGDPNTFQRFGSALLDAGTSGGFIQSQPVLPGGIAQIQNSNDLAEARRQLEAIRKQLEALGA